jgi:hypothetical protein
MRSDNNSLMIMSRISDLTEREQRENRCSATNRAKLATNRWNDLRAGPLVCRGFLPFARLLAGVFEPCIPANAPLAGGPFRLPIAGGLRTGPKKGTGKCTQE